MIDNARISVNGRIVRIQSESTLCSGEGGSMRRGLARLWQRFVCTFTTFRNGVLDRDLDFRVRVASRRRFIISDAHWVAATR